MVTKNFAEEVLGCAERIEGGANIGGSDLARILKRLTELEIEEGGPYALADGGSVDIGLNLAIARFLEACDVHLPKLDAYIERALSDDTTRSRILERKRLKQLLEWRKNRNKVKAKKVPKVIDAEEGRVMNAIRNGAQRRFKNLSVGLRQSAMSVVERTIKGNLDKQMSLMALYTRQALGDNGKRLSDQYIAELGLANIFFWTAFIIYDDFWDEDEAAEAKLLPVANLLSRHYTDFFTHLQSSNPGFRVFFHELMDELDAANSWETLHCRARVVDGYFHIPETMPAYGDFSIKFLPASGHILGPIAILIGLGHRLESRQIKQFIAYFKHYLIAMQLNDDMHDWKEDLARGHISTALSVLIHKWLMKYPDRRDIHLESDMSVLEQIFWFETLRPLCDMVLQHCSRSRQALESLTVFNNAAPLERFITRNENTAREALAEYQKSRDFLRIFS